MKRFFTLLLVLGLSGAARAERIESMATIKGAYPVTLRGVGLVTGLGGTGDSKAVAVKMLKELYGKQQINVAEADLTSQNVAVVSVEATLPPFVRPGARLRARVSSLNGATSLANGMLLTTHLRITDDGPAYAVASGRILIGGDAETDRFPTAGIIPDGPDSGAQVVRSRDVNFISEDGVFELLLNKPNFANAHTITRAINNNDSANPALVGAGLGGFQALDRDVPGPAQSLDAGTVIVQIPPQYLSEKVKYISNIMRNITVNVDVPPRVVLNYATNTVVITGEVTVSRAAVSHGNLTVNVTDAENRPGVKQVERAKTEAWPVIEVSDYIGEAQHLQTLVNTLNAMKVRPRDTIEIIQNLHRAGALHGELVVE